MSKLKLSKTRSFKPNTQLHNTSSSTEKIIDLTSANIVLQRALEIACSCENCDEWCFCEKTDVETCKELRCIDLIKKAQKTILSNPTQIKDYLK